MKATILYRVASVLLLVFAAANTIWLVYFWHAAAANAPYFPFGHSNLTYVQVVLALEVFGSLCVLFGGFLSWHLGALARTAPQFASTLGWGLVAYQTVGTLVTLFYLSGFALIITAAIAICTAWATSLVGTRTPESAQA
ncbi:hypothetical protein P8935_21900 [Telmatobacter sp. DSM 110680]|uniref:Uncharacterized protein n=1 Tax=Telmatobacter sp. DSM 110680 TaxID=3036704 RepID=A0AAU7DJE2_9BACT